MQIKPLVHEIRLIRVSNPDYSDCPNPFDYASQVIFTVLQELQELSGYPVGFRIPQIGNGETSLSSGLITLWGV